MTEEAKYPWTDNPTVSGVAECNTDILNDCLMHLKYDKKDGGSGFNLFDMVIKDHILSFEESKGLALQGTYVYKTPVVGSRYGYPDFVQKCIDEYKVSEQTDIVVGGNWIDLPTFTSNTTDGITISDSRGNTTVLQRMFNNYKTNTPGSNSVGNWSTYWLNIDYGQPTVLDNFKICSDNNGSPEYPSAWTIQGSNDGINFDILGSVTDKVMALNTRYTFYEGETFQQTKSYRQYRLVFSAGVEYNGNGEIAQITFSAKQAVDIRKNPNGHLFYNIIDKTVIDTFFDTYGVADFYGVDEGNERIFLPRNNWFTQLTTDASKVNQFNEAGLPNITADLGVAGGEANSPTGAVYAGSNGRKQGHDFTIEGRLFDASRSNPIYGKSDTVQPPSSNKLLYYVVGNTEQTSSITDVVDITTSENDTIPLGYSIYQGDGSQPSVAWLASNGQWNRGYTSFYNYYAARIGQKFAAGYVRNHTDEYTDYDLVINQDDMTFRLPLSNGQNPIIESGSNYNVYQNGYCEQWGKINCKPNAQTNGTLFKSFNSTDYNFLATDNTSALNGNVYGYQQGCGILTNNSFFVRNANDGTVGFSWRACGYLAEGDYTPQTLYFKVANAVQNLELLDIGKVTEALSNKVDITNTQWATDACMMDYSAGITLTNPFTAPCNGLAVLCVAGAPASTGNSRIYINDIEVAYIYSNYYESFNTNPFLLSKGDIIRWTSTNSHTMKFFPMKGVQNNA